MKTQHVESLEELVFKNKNKLYGAYLLRRKYNKHLAVALLFGLFIILSVISYPLLAAYLNPNNNQHIGALTGNYDPIDPAINDPPPPPPPPPPDIKIPEAIRFKAPTVVDKDVEPEMISQSALENLPSQAPPADDNTLEPVERPETVIEQPGPKQEPWISVEQPPEFPGGEPALFKYLAENLKYPPEAKELGVIGRVFVYFVVEPDGSVSSVSVKRGIGSGCDEEAVRVVQSLPRWSPGKQGGIAVRVQFTLPVKFVLH